MGGQKLGEENDSSSVDDEDLAHRLKLGEAKFQARCRLDDIGDLQLAGCQDTARQAAATQASST